MALLAKKLSFLPLTRGGCLQSFMRSASVARAISNRNIDSEVVRNSASRVDNDDEDDDDNDADIEKDTTSVVAVADDEEDDIQKVECRVFSTVARRSWIALQDETSLKFRMDMPGITRDHVKVYLDDAKLVVKGKYPPPPSPLDLDEDDVLADNEGSYSAEIELPPNVKKDQIKSEMKDGILLVTVPKEVTMITVE